MNYIFSLREAESDVSNLKVLGPYSGIQNIQLDYSLAAGQVLGVVDSFLTPAPLPNATKWAAGSYAVVLVVAEAISISFSVALYRADANGNILEQIGVTPSVQTADAAPTDPVNCSFIIDGELLATDSTDRLLLQLLAENTDGANGHTLSVICGTSGVSTPIAETILESGINDPYRRNKTLGIIPRPGERFGYFD